MRLLLILLLPALVFSQETPTFRAGVSLVKLDVQVLDGKRILAGLAREDFIVRDEEQPREIVHFGRESEPLWVLLLLDVSGSMQRRLAEMARAAKAALEALGPGDHLAVMVFSRSAEVTQPFTEDLKVAAEAIERGRGERDLGGGTLINPSILAAVDYLRKEIEGKPGRRALVILTDNTGLHYQSPDEPVLKALYEADVVLNAIVTPNAQPPPAGRYVNPDFTPPNVFLLAGETGGDIAKAANAGEAFRLMMESVRTRYSLHFHAPEDAPPGFRKINVELSPAARGRYRKVEIRGRKGYWR